MSYISRTAAKNSACLTVSTPRSASRSRSAPACPWDSRFFRPPTSEFSLRTFGRRRSVGRREPAGRRWFAAGGYRVLVNRVPKCRGGAFRLVDGPTPAASPCRQRRGSPRRFAILQRLRYGIVAAADFSAAGGEECRRLFERCRRPRSQASEIEDLHARASPPDSGLGLFRLPRRVHRMSRDSGSTSRAGQAGLALATAWVPASTAVLRRRRMPARQSEARATGLSAVRWTTSSSAAGSGPRGPSLRISAMR